MLMFSASCQLWLRPDADLYAENNRLSCHDSVDNDGDNLSDCNDTECTEICLCGNGVLNLNEACDDANQDPNDGCDLDCKISGLLCGNEQLDPDEACDPTDNQDDDSRRRW